jgi:16S rRNA (uracil1498-N3)-methyltransferase
MPMSVERVLVPERALVDGGTLDLDEAEVRHLRVRRVAAGSEVIACDGAGKSAHATLIARGSGFAVSIGVVQAADALPEITLAVGAGDKDRFATLAERCTELGVTRIVPLETERSQAVETRIRPASLERVRRRARDACKQSGNPWATRVDDPCRLDQLRSRAATARWYVGAADGAPCPPIPAGEHVGWIIGPEGGFTPAEIDYCLKELDGTPVAFAPAILRFDTAAIAAAVIALDRRQRERKE